MVGSPRPVPPRGAVTLTGPVRTCVGCRSRASAADLLRVVAVDGVLVHDRRRRLPGRGAWLHPTEECLRAAERRRAFPRALRLQAHGTLDASGLAEHIHAVVAQRDSDPVRDVPASSTDESESRSTRHESAVKLKP